MGAVLGSTSSGNTTYQIGDTVNSGSVEFKVNSVRDTKQIGCEYLGDKTNDNFIVINITIKNTGNKEITLTSSNFVLKRGESKYDTNSAGIYLDDGFYVMESLNPGITRTLSIVYEVPTLRSTGDYILEVSSSWLAKSAEIKLTK